MIMAVMGGAWCSFVTWIKDFAPEPATELFVGRATLYFWDL
jgi:hypothetical protein